MISEIHKARENRRPRTINKAPSKMLITHAYHEKYFAHGNWKNGFDHDCYCYYEDMKQPRSTIKRDRIAMKIADSYKKTYKGTHTTTKDKVYEIIRWLSKNTDNILVLVSDQKHYDELLKIYKRLSAMEIVCFYQGNTTQDKKTFSNTHHRTGIFLTAIALDMFKSPITKNKNKHFPKQA